MIIWHHIVLSASGVYSFQFRCLFFKILNPTDTVLFIQPAAQIQLLAAIRAIPVPEPVDLSHLATTDMVESLVAVEQAAYEDLSDDLEDLQDSVAALLLDADREPEWVDEIEEIQQRLEEIGWELGDLWWRTDMNEQACRSKTWCDDWYDENW